MCHGLYHPERWSICGWFIIALLTLLIFNSSNVEVVVGLQSVYIPTFESSSWPIMAPIFVAQYIMYAPLHMSYSLCSHVELYAHTHRRTYIYIYMCVCDYIIILYNYIHNTYKYINKLYIYYIILYHSYI